MTYKELLIRIKKDYEEAYEHIKPERSFWSCFCYLRKRNMDKGICYYSGVEYKVAIRDKPWMIGRRKTAAQYWCKPPREVNKRSELMQVMEKRIKRLGNIIKKEDLSACVPMI